MPANIYPLVAGDPTLKSCRHSAHQGERRVAAPAMCEHHPRTCLTCCGSRLKRDCGMPDDHGRHTMPGIVVPSASSVVITRMPWEQRQAEIAQIRAQLGFRPETEAEMAENERWRTR